MKNRKRIMAMLLTCMMVAMIFTGCGKSKDDEAAKALTEAAENVGPKFRKRLTMQLRKKNPKRR